MKSTRLSFFYLAGYLLTTGACFLLAPNWSLQILFAKGAYSEPFVRLVGSFMIALGTLVTQIIRHRAEALYRTTVGVRIFFISVFIWLYASTRDPLFLIMLGVVGLGVILTVTGLFLDRGRQA